MADWGFETRQIHAGAVPDPTTGARAVPIYQTTSYTFRDTAHAAALFGLEELGNIYTRIMNPTQAVFEERMAALEGGVAALAVASGQAAETIALLNLAENGGHVVSSASLYGGTYNLLPLHAAQARHRGHLRRRPRRPRRLAGRHPAQHQGLLRRDARQPQGRRPRLRRRVGHRPRARHPAGGRQHPGHPVPGPAAAATAPTSWCTRPPSSSAATARRSAASSSTAGTFDYEGSGRFPGFTEPDPSYHGLVFGELPEPLFPARFVLKARLQYLRDIGPSDRPAQLVPVPPGRSRRSACAWSATCRTPRRWPPGSRPATRCRWVAYPGLASSPWHERQQRYLPKGGGAILAFGIEGGAEAGRTLHRGARAVQPPGQRGRRAQPGHPPGVDHPLAADRGRAGRRPGVTPDLVRLCVGLESIEDILADLEAGFRAAKGA